MKKSIFHPDHSHCDKSDVFGPDPSLVGDFSESFPRSGEKDGKRSYPGLFRKQRCIFKLNQQQQVGAGLADSDEYIWVKTS